MIYLEKIDLIIPLLLVSFNSFAQKETAPIAKKIYTTQRINSTEIPIIDGQLLEPIWQNDQWAKDFIQRTPVENTAPTEATEFKIAYDSKFLYVGLKCHDSEPDKINSRMSRRDGYEGDWVELLIDSYHDLRSAFSLTVTAAGGKGDKALALNGMDEDPTWNPIWYAKSHINNSGWTAEMKIPLSQFKFGDSDNQVWGLQVRRKVFRKEEQSVWQRIPIDASGWVSEFGELHGLKDLKPQGQLEIQPFVVTSLKTVEKDPLNPYRNSNVGTINLGLDGKIGITNNLTLDLTINPDFGQVEADPAAIALDGFQLFFAEQRPFFIENKSIFNYKFSSPIIGGIFSSDNLFYSRRIGRSPQGSVSTSEGEYSQSPERTTLLGAAKLSGKTKNGWSIGILESLTSNEYVEINKAGETRKELIEPLSNYFVARVQKDFNNKNTFIGGILTSTYRDLNENVDFLHRSALTGGLDIKHQWSNRSWYAGANLVMSQVKGSKAAIWNTQTSIQHLFQRTDANYLSLDAARTSLSGTGGDIKLGKAGKGHVKFETGITWRSPGLELNDIGFMREADDWQNYLGLTYSSLQPFSIFRQAAISYRHWSAWDFGGNHNYFDWDLVGVATFKNFWKATFGAYSQPHIYSKTLLRGGPRVHLPDQYGVWWALSSDHRKKLYFDINGWTKTGGEDSYTLFENSLRITYRPINPLSISLRPRYTLIQNRLQFNEQVQFEEAPRYITSKLDQETFSAALRLNYSINSNLSIQYYGEPYITIGTYDDFSYVSAPLVKNQADQLAFFGQNQMTTDFPNTDFIIDENLDGTSDYTFSNPDFSFAQFRSNLVVRWEYRPGSEIFLVWSQGITDFSNSPKGLGEGFSTQIFTRHPENTFLLKATYRFFR